MVFLLKILDSYPYYHFDYSDVNFRDVFVVLAVFMLFFYGIHRLIHKFMPRTKGAIFQNSPVNADVLLQEKSYEIADDKTLSLSVRILSIFFLVVFVWVIASGFYTNWIYWFFYWSY